MNKPDKQLKTLNNLTLAIETAIAGGSLSLLDGQTELDFLIGSNERSKAEDVLENLSVLLKRNHLKNNQIGLIVVSNDIGSSTGLKIGLSIAKGLAKAFGCRLAEVSFLEAFITMNPARDLEKQTLVLPIGKNNVYLQCLANGKPSGNFSVVKRDVFLNAQLRQNAKAYAHQTLVEAKSDSNQSGLINIGENMASILGKAAHLQPI